MDQVIQPPKWLPGPTSRKWHNRRWRDGLGYLRVRTLNNPNWARDMAWLKSFIEREAEREDSETVRTLLLRAAAVARRYPRTASGASDADVCLGELLGAIDAALEARQHEHTQAVRAAGRSGI